MKKLNRRRLFVETLEQRRLLAASIFESLVTYEADYSPDEVFAHIVAGDPNGIDADSPSQRVDVNVSDSEFAGVGSIQISTRRGSYICTGTPIDDTTIVTAAHCVDINSDGVSNRKDGIQSVQFLLNYGGNLTHSFTVSSIAVHPDFTGFARPSVNDDVAVLKLSSRLPAGIPTYAMYTGGFDLSTPNHDSSTPLHMVGYGQSGSGTQGYTVNASFSVKRYGRNVVDAYYAQDDSSRPAANEVFRFDFDGRTGNGPMGGPTLGNKIETTLGGGDSGGPSFVLVGDAYQLAGINTFSQSGTAAAPRFGSLGGGMVVSAYATWINSLSTASSTNATAPNAGHGHGGDAEAIYHLMEDSPVPIFVGFGAPTRSLDSVVESRDSIENERKLAQSVTVNPSSRSLAAAESNDRRNTVNVPIDAEYTAESDATDSDSIDEFFARCDSSVMSDLLMG